MAYVRKTKNAAELSAARSAAGKLGAIERKRTGKCRGGRPRGKMADTEPFRSIGIHQSDCDYIDRVGFLNGGISRAATVRLMVLQYRELHPEVKMGEDIEKRLDEWREKMGGMIIAKS